MQTPARYHLDIGLTQFLRGRHDEALTAFRFASQYKALCFSTVSHPTGEPLTLVLPDTGEHVPFAGKPPNHYVGIPEWIDALALSITVRDSISTKSLVSFNDLYLLGVVQRGPTSNAFALPDAWKAVASNDPNARMLVTAAQDVTLHEPFHDHNVAPVLVAMARLCDGDGPGLVAALDEACKKRYRWLTEEPDGETQPGSAGDHKAAVHWPAAALARLGADRGIAQHKPNPYIPDFGPRFMRD